MRFLRLVLFTIAGALLPCPALVADTSLMAGFSEVDITPAVGGERPVYIAGYGMNRKATGVHDPLMARCVVLRHGDEKIAFVCADVVGLQYPTVKAIRARLPGLRYVMVSSTHNHEGPDVIGIWGRGPLHRGVDEAYLDLIIDRVVQGVELAEKNLSAVTASYGVAEDETLLRDSRLPIVKDGVLRVVRFNQAGSKTPAGLLVQWNCHPEALGPKNRLLTADFPWATVAELRKRYNCPLVYLSGAVGGLMAPPKERIYNAEGKELLEGDYEYARVYGEEVAALAAKAIDSAEPIELTPFAFSARPIAVPVRNALYRAARAFGVVKREGRVWTGSFSSLGEPMTREKADLPSAVESEVAYVRLGELHVACIPGELYPELVYGHYENPAAENVDYPTAPLEPTVASLMPGKKWLLVGLANDEIGYIIPKRQWDKEAPYAYGKDGGQYGEINSCGPEVAPIVMEALRLRVAECASAPPPK